MNTTAETRSRAVVVFNSMIALATSDQRILMLCLPDRWAKQSVGGSNHRTGIVLKSKFKHTVSTEKGILTMETKITQLFDIEHPIIQGGMHYVGFAELAAEVSNAGGLGIITALTQGSPAKLEREIIKCKT